jgi:LysR family transcriptional activator of nhaA
VEFLNYHHLRYFREVAREGGLKKAAEKLRVSQSTMSAQIQALESALGETLFRRSGRGLVLTEAGHRVLSYAEDIFALGQELLEDMKQRPASRPVRVHIGITDSLPKLAAYQIIKPVFRLPYVVQAVCREGKATDLLSQLAAFRLDIVLADEPAPSSFHLKAFNHLLGECGVCFCAAPALCAKLKRGFPQSLHGAPALLPTANNALRRSLEQWFHQRGIRPRLIAEFEDAALTNMAAIDGLGFVAIPNLVVPEALARYGFERIGSAEQCREQFYAISAERKLAHPAVLAITSQAQTTLFS